MCSLICTGCGSVYPIVNGIPRFVTGGNYADSFGMQWNLHRRTQLDSFTGVPTSRNRLFMATAWPERLTGEVILEAGSGAGRFTEVLITTGAQVYSFDYSAAVEANVAPGDVERGAGVAAVRTAPFAEMGAVEGVVGEVVAAAAADDGIDRVADTGQGVLGLVQAEGDAAGY